MTNEAMKEREAVGNPPAFPLGTSDGYTMQAGMSLRDYFAGQALAGLLAHASGEHPGKAPSSAYELADMMLRQRAEHLKEGR